MSSTKEKAYFALSSKLGQQFMWPSCRPVAQKKCFGCLHYTWILVVQDLQIFSILWTVAGLPMVVSFLGWFCLFASQFDFLGNCRNFLHPFYCCPSKQHLMSCMQLPARSAGTDLAEQVSSLQLHVTTEHLCGVSHSRVESRIIFM